MAKSMLSAALLLSAFIAHSNSHFLLNYPPTIGFDDDLEGTAPCGSFSVDFAKDNVTDFHVGGDALAMTSIHPQATWLFRATLDLSATGNWTSLLPAVEQKGLGQYCEQDVTVPASFAGSKGVIGVVQDAPDGILYQVRISLQDIIFNGLIVLFIVRSCELRCRQSNQHTKFMCKCDWSLSQLHHRPSPFESSSIWHGSSNFFCFCFCDRDRVWRKQYFFCSFCRKYASGTRGYWLARLVSPGVHWNTHRRFSVVEGEIAL
jgi:hypothetical protein